MPTVAYIWAGLASGYLTRELGYENLSGDWWFVWFLCTFPVAFMHILQLMRGD